MISKISFRGDPSDAMNALKKIEKKTNDVRKQASIKSGAAKGAFAGSLGAAGAVAAGGALIATVKEVFNLLRKGFDDAIDGITQLDDLRDQAATLGTSVPGVLGFQKTLVDAGASASDIPKIISAFADLARKEQDGDRDAGAIYERAGVRSSDPMIEQIAGIFKLMGTGGSWGDLIQTKLGFTGRRFEQVGQNLQRDGGALAQLQSEIKKFEDKTGYTANPKEWNSKIANAQSEVELIKLAEAQRPVLNVMSKTSEDLSKLVEGYRLAQSTQNEIYDGIQTGVQKVLDVAEDISDGIDKMVVFFDKLPGGVFLRK